MSLRLESSMHQKGVVLLIDLIFSFTAILQENERCGQIGRHTSVGIPPKQDQDVWRTDLW